MFITENSIGWPTGTGMVDGSILNSLSMTSTVAGAAAACSCVPPSVPPEVHDTVTIARMLAMLNSPHLRTNFIIVRSSSGGGSDVLPKFRRDVDPAWGLTVPPCSGRTAPVGGCPPCQDRYMFARYFVELPVEPQWVERALMEAPANWLRGLASEANH